MSYIPLAELLGVSGKELLSRSNLFFFEARLVQPGTSSPEEIISQLGISMNAIEQLNVAMLSK